MAFRFNLSTLYRVAMTVVFVIVNGVEVILVSYLVRHILLPLLLLPLLVILLQSLQLWLYDSQATNRLTMLKQRVFLCT